MKKGILIASALAVLATGATSLYAWGGPDSRGMKGRSDSSSTTMPDRGPGHHMGGHHGGPELAAFMRLDLTDDQQTSVTTLLEAYQTARDEARDALDDSQLPSAAFSSTAFDKASYVSLASGLMDEEIAARAELLEDLYALLTTDQKAELKEYMDAMNVLR